MSVSEIHNYPLRPDGVPEPLWMTDEWKRSVLDHLCESSWLCRASELPAGPTGTDSVHAVSKPVYILRRKRGSFVVDLQKAGRSTGSWRKRLIVKVVDLWREVWGWWCPDAVDRLFVRVMLSGGAIVDLARYGADEWKLVGVVD